MSLTLISRAVPVTVLLLGLLLAAACAPVAPATPLLAPPAPSSTAPAAAAPSPTPVPATAAPTPLPATAAPTAVAPASTALPTSAGGATAAGHWEGSVSVSGQNITTILDLTVEGDVLKGTADFPQQNALSLPLDKVSQQGNKVHFEVLPAPRTAVFDGDLIGSDQIQGTFTQAGFTGDFTLIRKAVAAAEPVPYREEEVKFTNGAVTLAGTLTLPQGDGPFPAVVLITGSGAQNRDEDIFGFKIFRVLADGLTRQGIAVLRYDDRGIGGSSAGTEADTSETFAGDVSAAVEFLKGRAEINPKQIGVLGHSEGGIIAPIVAAHSPDVSFVILMSGPGLPGAQIIEEQARLINEASGVSPEELKVQADLQKRAIDAALSGKGWDAVRADMIAELKKTAAAMPESQRQTLGDIDTWAAKSVDAQIAAMESPWMQFFLTHDPATVLEQVKQPVLALFGGKDLQVPAEENKAAIVAALEKGGNKDVTVKVFHDANHLYQVANTGSPIEYASLKPEFVPGFLDTIGQWILAHTTGAQK
jgi:pimeloyl-ACP methyl ester carboxylesterase